MKKRFVAILLMFVMCLSVLTGCSLFELDEQSYYNAVVCTINFTDGEVVNIDKRELLLAWSSYGYNYEQNYGYTREQAIKTTLDSIVDQKVTRKAVENYYKANDEEILNDAEKTYLWDYTYESVYGNLEGYFQEIVDVPSGGEGEESKTKLFTVNIPEIELTSVKALDKDGNEIKKLALKKTSSSTPTTTRETYTARYEMIDGKSQVYDFEFEDEKGNRTFKEKMYEKIYSATTGEYGAKNWRGAFSKYISAIKENYPYLKYKTEKEWFMFELDRVYDILKGNYLVEQYTKIFNVQEHNGSTVSGVSVDDVLKRYSAKMKQDYETYKYDKEGFETAVIDGLANMEYIWQGDDATNFFQIAYIKLAFDETQQKEYDALKDGNAYVSDPEFRQQMINKIYENVKVTVKDEYGDAVKVKNSKGEEVDKTVDLSTLLTEIEKTAVGSLQYKSKITAQDVSDEVKAELEKERGEKTLDQAIAEYVEEYNKSVEKENQNTAERKADAFRPFLYQYNSDETQRNTTTNLVFGVKTNGEVIGKSDLTDIKGVSEEIKKLYEKNEIGALSAPVRADDGIYLFFYCGEVKNIFQFGNGSPDIASREDNIYVLAHTYQNIFSRKTLLESIYNECITDKFTVFHNLDVAYLRSHLAKSIQGFDQNLKDLYNA